MAAARRAWAAAGGRLQRSLPAPWLCNCRTRLRNRLPTSHMLVTSKPLASSAPGIVEGLFVEDSLSRSDYVDSSSDKGRTTNISPAPLPPNIHSGNMRANTQRYNGEYNYHSNQLSHGSHHYNQMNYGSETPGHSAYAWGTEGNSLCKNPLSNSNYYNTGTSAGAMNIHLNPYCDNTTSSQQHGAAYHGRNAMETVTAYGQCNTYADHEVQLKRSAARSSTFSNQNVNFRFSGGRMRSTIEDLEAALQKRELSDALQVLKSLDSMEVKKLDDLMFDRLMKLCVESESSSITDVRYLHEQSFQSVGNGNLLVNNRILEMYAKHNSMEDAKKLFKAMPLRDTNSWNNYIVGCASNGLGEEAADHFTQFIEAGVETKLGLFVELAIKILTLLEEKGVVLEISRYFQLINVCQDAATAKEAMSVHEHIKRAVGLGNISINNKILQMYAKCNAAKPAQELFDSMPNRNLTSWDNVILACSNGGLCEEALDYFTQFLQRGLQPDSGMFATVFLACGAAGAVDEGMLHFESMEKEYGIVPCMEHYVSIVKMLGECGYVEEAMEFVEQMPLEPSVDVWEVMMNISRSYGHLELGSHCAEMIERLDSSRLNGQSRSGLLPIEASEVERDKEIMKRDPSDKTKGYQYTAGDKSHPDHLKLYQHLRFVVAQMKEEGYVADLRSCLHDVHPEVKEMSLLAHSERLALVEALLTSEARSELRVLKNLRSCVDCHQAFKLMSKLSGRKFIVRDLKRWHHFSEGKCNCNDYW